MENFKVGDDAVNKYMEKHAVDEEVMIAAAAFPLPPAKLIQLCKVGADARLLRYAECPPRVGTNQSRTRRVLAFSMLVRHCLLSNAVPDVPASSRTV